MWTILSPTYNHTQSEKVLLRTAARHTSAPAKWNFKKLYILYLILFQVAF